MAYLAHHIPSNFLKTVFLKFYVLLCFGLYFFFISAIFCFVHLDLLLHFWKTPNNIVL